MHCVSVFQHHDKQNNRKRQIHNKKTPNHNSHWLMSLLQYTNSIIDHYWAKLYKIQDEHKIVIETFPLHFLCLCVCVCVYACERKRQTILGVHFAFLITLWESQRQQHRKTKEQHNSIYTEHYYAIICWHQSKTPPKL